MDGGPLWAAVHGVAKSWTRLSDFTFPFHFHASEKEMATHSSVLAWTIPGTGEPGGLPSMGLHRVGHDWSDLAAAAVKVHAYLVVSDSLQPHELYLPSSSEIILARILEWVAISFFRGSSWPRDWTYVSCGSWIGRWILYHWAPWEAYSKVKQW